jgi:hypothetical protein
MRSTLRTAALLFAILAILAPWVVDAGVALHIVLEADHGHEADHHDQADLAEPTPAGVHGHAHQDGTPAHDHGSSFPEGATRVVRALTVSWTAGSLTAYPPDTAAWQAGTAATATPSPPTVSTTILRI